mmetsp:Transcript_3241/g.7388  ORF Transcript_3241/g.7388 Transcript_3241/m.7388 type:complete len:178 (-) Transcript_3241:151-684(-)|eukprot:CAMPEP_0201128770 /NCGR_PEP_ID=MMETSP0850-20130426/34738_1 /ASSEMBLY_ACC=CAM_ASM_000622 /TAXON_ID=183588 /ORGANISM="Pseudo-nitzschia fraudulenta, Strain WWA7" /LENGTH=177 /DNA_ID=CAMNT_0047398053 /DNA_START=58 /DNA_END=591 /DNA_ORIENTATION=-
MKRSLKEFRDGSVRRCNDDDTNTPIVIEFDDDNIESIKRPREDTRLFNFLIRALTDGQFDSKNKVDVNDAVNDTANGNSTAPSTIGSSTLLSARNAFNATNSSGIKRIVDHVPSDVSSLSFFSNHESASSVGRSLPLPDGRPLMAPPRLPTKFIPGQVKILSTGVMSCSCPYSLQRK